jgi:hypothetical protein
MGRLLFFSCVSFHFFLYAVYISPLFFFPIEAHAYLGCHVDGGWRIGRLLFPAQKKIFLLLPQQQRAMIKDFSVDFYSFALKTVHTAPMPQTKENERHSC